MPRAGVAIASCLLLTLFACASDSSSAGTSTGGDLTGVTWVLDQASMMTLVDAVPKDARIDIAFDGTQVHGRSACNTYGGSYEANSDDGTLSISQLAGTQMACGGLMDIESAYLAALGNFTA
jgi:heat shock protein HslJ